jgi:hypothetical protein
MYRSFHEALKELSREQYGNVMYAINEYALDGKLTEELTGIEKAVFLMAKPQLDANRQRRENGAKGGRPKEENEKPMVNEIENQTKPEVIKNGETEKPNVNANDNGNENENAHTDACVPAYISEPNKKINKELAERMHAMIQEHNETAPKERRVPISNNLFNFSCKEMREFIGAVGTLDAGSPANILNALQNFLKVCKSDTWMKSHSWSNFCKHYADYTPEFFTLERYLNAEPETEDATQKPEYKFYMRMRTEARFHVETFEKHVTDWKNNGRPEGADYYKLQDEWEAEKC